MGCCGNENNNINRCSENPCAVQQENTPTCESLPSQVENFSKQFFGTVVKSEINGVVTWALPCNLDVGLPNNPRQLGEGLACYFLRLFGEGIVGLTGPQGNPGANGDNGRNAYTVTLQSFVQPTLGAPIIELLTQFNPAILAGLNVFIDTSGWYVVNNNDSSGALSLTLTQALPGASGTITAGKLVVPAGVPGQSVVGPTGPQGTQGPQGNPGNTFSSVNDFYFAPIGTDYNLQIVYAAVNFVNSSPQVLLPDAGTYLITAVVDVVGLAGVAASDIASFKLFDTSILGDIPGSEHMVSNLIDTQRSQVMINVIYETIQTNSSVALFGKATTADRIAAVALHTTLSFVRLE